MSARKRRAPSPAASAAPAPATPRGLSDDWKARAALVAVALLAYLNSFSSDLVQDARALLTLDPRIRAATLDNLRQILTTNYWWPKSGDGLYRPVTTASLLFNYAILGSGQGPAGYHAVNFLLHALNVCLVYMLAKRLFNRVRPAFIAAALWAVHPIGTEAVTNIAGRADLLAALAVLGGLWLYVRAPLRWAGAAALFAIATLGVFAKENAAVLLGLMVLWDLYAECWNEPNWLSRRVPAYAAVMASLVLLLAARHAVLGALPSPQIVYVDNPLRATAFLAARWTAIKVVGLQLGLLLWPAGLACDRSFNQIPVAGWGDPAAWLAFLLIVAIVAGVLLRRDRLLFLAAGFLGIALLPTSNLVVPIGSVMAERFLYLPSVGFAIAVAALAERAGRERVVNFVLAAGLLLLGVRTVLRNQSWHDNLALASSDVATAPGSFKIHEMLAKSLYDQDERRNLDRAIREEEQAWAILKPLPPVRSTPLTPYFLGIYYRFKGDAVGGPTRPEGREWYEKSVAVLERGRVISEANEAAFDQAQRDDGKPLSDRGASLDVYFNLAVGYLGLDRYAEALDALRYARGLDPRRPDTYDGMVLAYRGLNQPEGAVVVMLEKARISGFEPATLSALRDMYRDVPGGQCAFLERGGTAQLDRSCPRVGHDLCYAYHELVDAHRTARMFDAARDLQNEATQKYGCPGQ